MEWHIEALKALADTHTVIESHWRLDHTVAPYTVRRFGIAQIPSDPAPLQYEAALTEAQAVEATKAVLGPEYVAELEAAVLAEMEVLTAQPATITGLPWAPPNPPAPVPPAPAPPAARRS